MRVSATTRRERRRPVVTGDHLLAPDRRPVPVPTDEASPDSNVVPVWLAVFVLAAAVLGGVVYQQVWVDAGGEVTRLVPASTPAFITIPRPFEQLARARELDRFADPAAIEHVAQTAGPFADGAAGSMAGVPLSVLRRLLTSADALRVVTQASPGGTSVLLFFEITSERERRVLKGQLASVLTTTGRTMGHPIESFRADGGPLPWTDDALRTRLVELEPHIVLGFGTVEGVEDLIQARVTGRSQPIARRDGFDARAEQAGEPLWAALDPAWVADLARPLVDRAIGDPVGFRLSVVERVRAVTVTDAFDDREERLSLQLQTREGALTESARPALRGSAHTLLRSLPLVPSVAFSVSLESPGAGLAAMTSLLPRAAAMLVDAEAPGERSLVARFTAVMASVEAANLERAFAGQAVWVIPQSESPDPNWLFAVELVDSAVAEGVIESMVAAALGPDWRFGTIFGEGSAWHVAEPDDGDDGAVAEARLVWRVLDGIVVFAPSVPAIEAVAGWGRDGAPPLVAVERALRPLPPRPTVVALGDLASLNAVGPPGIEVVTARLRPDFLTAASVELSRDAIRIVSNLGAFTALGAFAGTARTDLDAAGGAELPEGCAGAMQVLCRSRPLAFLCEPFAPGRRALLADACARSRPMPLPGPPQPE
ncbi:MAG: hypothetical protein R3F39_18600 [Myxococcota bacterium]